MSTIDHNAWLELSKIMKESRLITTDSRESWTGCGYLHLELKSRWSNQMECWLIHRGLPDTLHDVSMSPACRVCTVQVFASALPCWTVDIGHQFVCKARINASDDQRCAYVESPMHVWRVGTIDKTMPINMIHTFSGSFNGWSQAAQCLEGICDSVAVESAVSVEYMEQSCMIAAKNEGAKILFAPYKQIIQPLPDHVVVCCHVENQAWLSAIHRSQNLIMTASFHALRSAEPVGSRMD